MEEEPPTKRRNTSTSSRGIDNEKKHEICNSIKEQQQQQQQPKPEPESMNSTFCAIVSTYIGSSSNDDDDDERASPSCQNKQWWMSEWNQAIVENRLDPNVFCMYALQRYDDEPKPSSSDDAEHDDDSTSSISSSTMDCSDTTQNKVGDETLKHSTAATTVVEEETHLYKKRRTDTARADHRQASSSKNIEGNEKSITTTEISSHAVANLHHNFLWTGVFKSIDKFSEIISKPHNRQVLENWLWKFRSSSSSSNSKFPINISFWQRVNGTYNNRAMLKNEKQGTGRIIMIREHSFDSPSSYRIGIQMLCQLASTSLIKEQHCTSYDILTSCDVLNRPHDVLECASWSSHEAYEEHIQTDYYQIALTKLKSLFSLNKQQIAPSVLWIRSTNGLYDQQSSSSPPELASLVPAQATAAAMITSATANTIQQHFVQTNNPTRK